jgi:hypothetical protein
LICDEKRCNIATRWRAPLKSNEIKMKLKLIGYVSNRVWRKRYKGWRRVVSEIIIDTEYAEALEGLEGFSHARAQQK